MTSVFPEAEHCNSLFMMKEIMSEIITDITEYTTTVSG